MPRRQAFSVWRDRCRKRADKEFDEHIDNDEFGEFMSEVYGDLYHTVVDAWDRYFEVTHTITADGSASYDEPDDHLSTIGLDRIVDAAGRREPLEKLDAQERHKYAGETGTAFAYMLVDDQIYLFPRPSSGTYELIYTPQPPDLTSYADGDLLDVVNVYGEQFLLHGVAALAKAKAEEDTRFHVARQEMAREKLLDWAIKRAAHDPHRRYNGDPDEDE